MLLVCKFCCIVIYTSIQSCGSGRLLSGSGSVSDIEVRIRIFLWSYLDPEKYDRIRPKGSDPTGSGSATLPTVTGTQSINQLLMSCQCIGNTMRSFYTRGGKKEICSPHTHLGPVAEGSELRVSGFPYLS